MIGGERHCLIEKHWARADFEATLYPPKPSRSEGAGQGRTGTAVDLV